MSWLSSMQGASGASGAASSGASSAATSGLFSKIGDYLATDKGKQGMAEGIQAGQQASATAAGQGQQATQQGMSAAQAGGSFPTPQAAPQAGLQSPGYNPLEIYERLAAFQRRG